MEHAELVTIGSLVTAPHLARQVGWLRSRDFASPDSARVFAALTSMTRAGLGVDRVLVVAQLHRDGVAPADGDWDGLLTRAVAAVPVAAAVGFYARQVLDAAVVDRVRCAGRRLIELGQRRPGGAEAMLGAALAELDGLGDVHRRLRRSRAVVAVRQVPELERMGMGRTAVRERPARTAG